MRLKPTPLPAVPVCLIAALVTLGLTAPTAQGFPEPAIVSPSWQLDFSYDRPEPIAVPGIDGEVRWYWYMPYQVVNHTGAERLFIPEITIADDRGAVLPADQGIPPAVFAAVKDRLKNPHLESAVEIVGRLLQGEDYARDGVAIWPAEGFIERDADEMIVFIGGLSGETAQTTNPQTGETIMLRRTRMLRFALPGDFESPERQPVLLMQERDVMR